MNKQSIEVKVDTGVKVPDRTRGLSILCAMVVFAAVWMSLQSAGSNSTTGTSATISAEGIAGFRSDAWYLPDDELLGFVKIPAGPFVMGSNPAVDRWAYENERWSGSQRQGSVNLPDFYIARFEVTVAQFRAFVKDSPQSVKLATVAGAGSNPIANITWPEALAYARWLEEKMKTSQNTPAEIREFLESGGQLLLPSEAEWEKAARGTNGRVFPWGNDPGSGLTNYGSTSALPVGYNPCNECAHGLSDMSGNVWELTRSPLQPYPYDPEDDAENLADDALWVMRGGGYADAIGNVRGAVRGGVDPGVRNSAIGFRLVISKI